MIPKRIDIEPENDNFAALAEYIAAAKDEGEKLEALWIENCNAGDGPDDLDLAIEEIKATQALNQRTKACKTYHLMISFRDEHPSLEALKDIEREFALALGYAEHQRIIGTHVNTDNFHMHIAINKIHPTTLKAHTPLRDFKTLERVSREVELKYGLKVDLGRADKLEADRRPQRARDKEAHTWEQSFDGYLRENKADLMDALSQAKDWRELHTALDQLSIELRPRGNGLVIADADGKYFVKASSIDRLFSKPALEKRYGQYQPLAPSPEQVASQSNSPAEPLAAFLKARKAELMTQLGRAGGWQDLHAAFAELGLELRLRGNGLVIDDGKGKSGFKASSVDRAFSKAALEKRFGHFQVSARNLQQQVHRARPQSAYRGSGKSQAGSTAAGIGQSVKARKRYKKRPITRHPGQGRLWRRYLGGQRKRSSLVKFAFNTWKDFLLLEASTDPLALAIVISQRQILQAINPLPPRQRKSNNELSR